MSNYENRLNDNNLNLINIMNTVSNLPDAGGGGTGDVKLFDSIANMQADPNPVEDGLAIVYYGSTGNLTADTEFQVATFPETVTLPSAVTSAIAIEFVAVDGSSFDCWGTLTARSFRMDVYGSGTYRIQYTSSDGINYTRTQISGPDGMISDNDVDFGTIIKFGGRYGDAKWNDAIGYFMQVGSVEYQGLFQYKDNSYDLARTQLDTSPKYVYDGKQFYGSNGVETGALMNSNSDTKDDLAFKMSLYNGFQHLTFHSQYGTSSMFFGNNNITNVPSMTFTNAYLLPQAFGNCKNLESIGNLNIPNCNTAYGMFSNCTNLVTVGIINMPLVQNGYNMFVNCNNLSEFSCANIINSIPDANTIGQYVITYWGLTPSLFTSSQKNTLYNMGYLDCDQNISDWSTQYNYYDGTNWNIIDRGEDYDRSGLKLKSNLGNPTNVTLKSIGNDPRNTIKCICFIFF